VNILSGYNVVYIYKEVCILENVSPSSYGEENWLGTMGGGGISHYPLGAKIRLRGENLKEKVKLKIKGQNILKHGSGIKQMQGKHGEQNASEVISGKLVLGRGKYNFRREEAWGWIFPDQNVGPSHIKLTY
jgi:hypothetical protein